MSTPFDRADAVITALGDEATLAETEYALRDFPDRVVRVALAKRAAAGGGAGSITEITSDDESVTITDPTGPVVDLSAVGGAGAVLKTSVTLTNAEILTLPTTPVQILAAPGAGKCHILIVAFVAVDTTAANFTNVNPNGKFVLEMVGSVQGFLQVDPFENLLGWGGKVAYQAGQFTAASAVPAGYLQPRAQSLDDSGNVALTLYADNGIEGNFTGGNAANTMKVTVLYAVEDIL